MKFRLIEMFDAMKLQPSKDEIRKEIKQIKTNPDIAKCFAQQLATLTTVGQRVSGTIIFFIPTAAENTLNRLYVILNRANLLTLENLREFGASRFCKLTDTMASSPQEYLERLNNILLLINTSADADTCLTQENFTWILKQPDPKTVFLVFKQYNVEEQLNHHSIAFIKTHLAAKHSPSIEMLHSTGKLTAFALTAILRKKNFKATEDILALLQSLEILSLHVYAINVSSLMAKSDDHLNNLGSNLQILSDLKILRPLTFDELSELCELEEQAGFLSMIQKLKAKNLITLNNIRSVIFHHKLLLDKNINLWVELNGKLKNWGFEFIETLPLTQSILDDYFEICGSEESTLREKRNQLKEYRTKLFMGLNNDPDKVYENPFLSDEDDIEEEIRDIKLITNGAHNNGLEEETGCIKLSINGIENLSEEAEQIKNIAAALIEIVKSSKTLNWANFILAFNNAHIKTLADAFQSVDLTINELDEKYCFLNNENIYHSEKIFSELTPTLISFFRKEDMGLVVRSTELTDSGYHHTLD